MYILYILYIYFLFTLDFCFANFLTLLRFLSRYSNYSLISELRKFPFQFSDKNCPLMAEVLKSEDVISLKSTMVPWKSSIANLQDNIFSRGKRNNATLFLKLSLVSCVLCLVFCNIYKHTHSVFLWDSPTSTSTFLAHIILCHIYIRSGVVFYLSRIFCNSSAFCKFICCNFVEENKLPGRKRILLNFPYVIIVSTMCSFPGSLL